MKLKSLIIIGAANYHWRYVFAIIIKAAVLASVETAHVKLGQFVWQPWPEDVGGHEVNPDSWLNIPVGAFIGKKL